MTWLKRFLYALIVIIIVVMLIILYLGYSETGLKIALKIAKSQIPGLTVTGIKGNLFQESHADKLTYKTPTMTITGDNVNVHWQLKALLYKPFHAYANWALLQIKPANQPAILAKKGHVVIDGTLKAYHAKAKTIVSSANFPAGEWTLTGNGNLTSFNIQQLKMLIKPGHLILHGPVHWSPTLSWNLHIDANNLDPSMFMPSLQGKINMQLKTSGDYGTTLNQLQVNILKLDGQYLKHPLNGQGRINFNKDQINVGQLHLKLGDNKIDANGKIGNQSNLTFTVHLPQLSQLMPDYQGNIESEGRVIGDINEPVIIGKANITHLNLPSIQIKQIKADVNLHTHFIKPSSVNIEANGFDIPGLDLRKLTLFASGNLKAHQIDVNAHIHHEKILMTIIGQYSKKAFHENIDRFTITNKTAGDWQLQQKPTLDISNTDFTTTPFCWRSDQQGQLCIKGNWHKTAPWQMQVTTKQFNIALLNLFLPKTLHLQSRINTQLNLAGHGLKGLKGKLNIDMPKIRLKYGQTLGNHLSLDGTTIVATLDKSNGFNTHTHFVVGPLKLPIELNAALPDFKGDTLPNANSKIEASLKMNWKNLQDIADAVPLISIIKGELDALIHISGTLGKPNVNGHIHLKQAEMKMGQLGLDLQKLAVTTNIKNNQATLQASVHSGKGDLNATGKMHILNPNQSLEINIKGQNVTVMNTREYHIIITPNLKLHFTDNRQIITGSVDIPYAKIKPQDYGSTVTLPDNFIIINQHGEKETPTALPVYLTTTVTLGKSVHLDYSNLIAKLGGHIKINAIPDKPMTAQGKIIVEKGKYEAYGNKLTTRRGIVTFNGGPISNPVLDILAVRTIQVYGFAGSNANADNQIIAGVQVTGPVNNLKITLYSEPAMSQSNILSYLLFGRPSSAVGGDNSAVLGQALLMLSSGTGGGSALNETRKNLGLSTLSVESSQNYTAQGPQSSTSFVVGKKLTKDLEALYSAGLTIPINVVMLRYTISNNWRAQMESSNYENGADIFYTFETD